MADSTDRLSVLEGQVAALRAQVTALVEERAQQEAALGPVLLKTLSASGDLRQSHRQPLEAQPIDGTLTYAGEVQFAGKQQRTEQVQDVAPLFEIAPYILASVFAALASPHRIVLLRSLFHGPRTRQQLADVLGMNSTGQLYHHLKELLAVGLVVQRGRSLYSINPVKVIPIGIALMAASHLMSSDWGVHSRDQEAHGTGESSER